MAHLRLNQRFLGLEEEVRWVAAVEADWLELRLSNARTDSLRVILLPSSRSGRIVSSEADAQGLRFSGERT